MDKEDDETLGEAIDRIWWSFVGGLIDWTTVILYVADILTDLLVIVSYYEMGLTEYADTALAFFLITPAFGLLLVIIQWADALDQYKYYLKYGYYTQEKFDKMWPRLIIMTLTIPILPLYMWAVNYFDCFEDPVSQWPMRASGQTSMKDEFKEAKKQLKNVNRGKKKKNEANLFNMLLRRAIRESGLFVETIFESIPQSILQFYVQLKLSQFDTVSIISIVISLLQIFSKTFVIGIDKIDRVKVYLAMNGMSLDIIYMFTACIASYLSPEEPWVYVFWIPLFIRFAINVVASLIALYHLIHLEYIERLRWDPQFWRNKVNDFGRWVREGEKSIKVGLKNLFGGLFIFVCFVLLWLLANVFNAGFSVSCLTMFIRVFLMKDTERKSDVEIYAYYMYNKPKVAHLGTYYDVMECMFLQQKLQYNKKCLEYTQEEKDQWRQMTQAWPKMMWLSKFGLGLYTVTHTLLNMFFIGLFVFVYDDTIGSWWTSHSINSVTPGAIIIKNVFMYFSVFLLILYIVLLAMSWYRTNNFVDQDQKQLHDLNTRANRRKEHLKQFPRKKSLKRVDLMFNWRYYATLM